MIMVASIYWNMIHEGNPDDVIQYKEGMQIMRTLVTNMVRL